MKLISLWEPWATLMAIGAKKIETRSWSTSHRGWLAIQASKGGLSKSDLEIQCEDPEFRRTLMAIPAFADWMNCVPGRGGIVPPGVFPYGHIVAVVNLADCARMVHCGNCDGRGWQVTLQTRCTYCGGCGIKPACHDITEQEAKFGNYDLGRYGWVTNNLFRLPEPIPFKAKQGLCDVDAATLELIRAQWRERA